MLNSDRAKSIFSQISPKFINKVVAKQFALLIITRMEVCQLLKPKVRSVWDFFYYKMATYHTNLSKSFNLWEITWLLKCTDDSTKNKKFKKKIMKLWRFQHTVLQVPQNNIENYLFVNVKKGDTKSNDTYLLSKWLVDT